MTCVFWKEIFQKPKPLLSWDDKAYISKKLQKQAKLQGKEMITPKKKPIGGKLTNTELAENKKISKTRQFIESNFALLYHRNRCQKSSFGMLDTRINQTHLWCLI